jgi:glycosyltransferase involved in cell wall biosynthesis
MSAPSRRPPRAAILAAYISPLDARLAKQTAALVEQGWQVELLSWESATGVYPTLPSVCLLPWRAGLSVSIVKNLPTIAQNLARAAAQRRIMETTLVKGGFDVVIASDPETLRPAARAKKNGHFALVYDAHEYYPDEVPNDDARAAWVVRVHRQAARSVDAFFTVNQAIAELYQQTTPELGVAKLVHNASPRRPPIKDDGRLRRLAGVQDGVPILLFQGGLARDRGLAQLVQAIDLVKTPMHLVLMGSGTLETDLRQCAGQRVTFIPPQKWDELHHWTAGATLGAVLYEGTCANQRLCSPNKLWEYPSAGVPLLASNLPFLGRAVADNNIGFVVDEPLTPQAISAKLNGLTPDALKQARANAIEFAQSSSWEKEAAVFVDAITRVGKVYPSGQPVPGPL